MDISDEPSSSCLHGHYCTALSTQQVLVSVFECAHRLGGDALSSGPWRWHHIAGYRTRGLRVSLWHLPRLQSTPARHGIPDNERWRAVFYLAIVRRQRCTCAEPSRQDYVLTRRVIVYSPFLSSGLYSCCRNYNGTNYLDNRLLEIWSIPVLGWSESDPSRRPARARVVDTLQAMSPD